MFEDVRRLKSIDVDYERQANPPDFDSGGL